MTAWRARLGASIWRGGVPAALLVVLAVLAANPAYALADEPAITAQPALQPSFSSTVPNYVTRCEPDGSVQVTVHARGNLVSVDGGTPQLGRFETSVSLAEGQA